MNILKVKVTKPFHGRQDGEASARLVAFGDVIEGDLARVALENKWAEEVKEPSRPTPKGKAKN